MYLSDIRKNLTFSGKRIFHANLKMHRIIILLAAVAAIQLSFSAASKDQDFEQVIQKLLKVKEQGDDEFKDALAREEDDYKDVLASEQEDDYDGLAELQNLMANTQEAAKAQKNGCYYISPRSLSLLYRMFRKVYYIYRRRG